MRKVQKSKRARGEEKLFKMLRHMGMKIKLTHLTSHNSASRFRPKDRWHGEHILRSIK